MLIDAGRAPDTIALADVHEKWTYRRLDAEVSRFATRLRRAGVAPGMIVPVLAERTPRTIVALLAVSRAGGAFSAVDLALPQARQHELLADCAGPVVVAPHHVPVPAGPHILAVTDDAGGGDDEPMDFPEPPDDAPCYVVYTSGSTGSPKGVVISHGGLRLVASEQRRLLDTSGDCRVYQLAAVGFDAFVFELSLALCSGGTLVLPGRRAAYAGPEATARMRAERVTHLVATPTGLAAMEPEALPELRIVCSVGEPGSPAVLNRWAPGRRLLNLYGPAEATIWATWAELSAGADPAVIGQPIAPVTAQVLDDRQEPVPDGTPGELFLFGPTVALGYHRRPELTGERFRDGGYATGDLVVRDANGLLRYLGRTDEQVKIDGARVEPGEVEHVLGALPGVDRAAVVALTGDTGATRLAAAYSGAPSPDAVASRLRERLPRWMVPAKITRMGTFPLTHNGKLDRSALREQLAAELAAWRVMPGLGYLLTPLQDLVLREARGLLDGNALTLQDNFFDCGGNSLRGLQLVVRIGDWLGVELDLNGLLAAENLGAWVDEVERRVADPDAGEVAPVAVTSADDALAGVGETEILVAERYLAGSAAYLQPWCEHVTGEFDLDRFAAALSDAVRRHDALRTRFRVTAERVVAIVDPEPKLGIERVDLPDGTLTDAIAAVERACRRPFELSDEQPVRLQVVAFGADRLVTVIVHHVACDAASFPILIDETWRRYRGEPVPPGNPVSYRDYAAWQHRFLTTPEAARQREWWRTRLAGTAPLRLGPDSGVRARAGRRMRFAFDADTTGAIDTTCAELRITPFALLSAAYTIALERYATATDSVIGTLCTTRGIPAFDGTIGLFVSTLPLRLTMPAGGPVDAWLSRWGGECLAMFARRDLPLSEISTVWQPPEGRSTRLSTLFAVNYWHLDPAGRHVPLDPGPVKFELLLSINLDPGVNIGELIHDTQALPPADAEDLLARFFRALQAICAAPYGPVSALFDAPVPMAAADFDLGGDR